MALSPILLPVHSFILFFHHNMNSMKTRTIFVSLTPGILASRIDPGIQ